MKKFLSLSVSLLFLTISFTSAQNLDKILDNHFNAVGQDKLAKVKTITSKGNVVQMGMNLPFVLIQKKPFMIRMDAEIQGSKFVQAYDGEHGWMIAPWAGNPDAQDMPIEQIKAMKDMSDIDGDLYNWKKKGYNANLIGKEELDGKPVFKVKLIKDNGDEYMYYIDAEKYVVLRTDIKTNVQGTDVNSSTLYSDFKPVEGILLPHTMESKMNGQVVSRIEFDSYKINETVDNAVFAKPAPKNSN